MFLKLMKYELRDCLRIFAPLWGAILALALVNCITLPISENIEKNFFAMFAMSLPWILFAGLLTASFVLAVVVLISHFCRGLLGAGGYLSHTLPVSKAQLLGAKLLGATVIEIGSVLVACLAGGLVMGLTTDGFFRTIFSTLSEIFELANQFPQSYLLLLEGLVFLLALLSFWNLRFYSAAALGHLFNKHRTLWSVAFYVVIGWITQLTLLFMGWSGMGVLENWLERASLAVNRPEEILLFLAQCGLPAILLVGVGAGLLWAITQFILQKHLNLQ